jgi:hypothetical protein
METIQWRPEVNALTTPQSYTVRYMARNVLGYDELAAEMARDNPLWDAELIKAMLLSRDKTIMRQLIKGNKVTLEEAFSYRLSFHARLERLPMSEKLPLITSSEDTKVKLTDVLNPSGVLHLTGGNLFFEEDDPDCGCVIKGTRSGETKQTTYASISNSEILLVPDIPAQTDPWNNEYRVSVTTQYTEHGTPRTGIYRRRLRTPLALTGFSHPNPAEVGILTGNADRPGGGRGSRRRLQPSRLQRLRGQCLGHYRG